MQNVLLQFACAVWKAGLVHQDYDQLMSGRNSHCDIMVAQVEGYAHLPEQRASC